MVSGGTHLRRLSTGGAISILRVVCEAEELSSLRPPFPSATPPLHYSTTTPLLHHYTTTPILHYYTTTLLHYTTPRPALKSSWLESQIDASPREIGLTDTNRPETG